MCIRSLRLGFVSRFILKMRSLRCWGVREILSIGGRLSVAGWIWRLYHATGDGRLFNYPVHLARSPSKDAEQPQPTLPISPGVRCASASCMLAYSCKVTGEADTILPPSQNQVEEMRTTVLVLASTTLALLLGSGAALLNALKPAEATFSGKNGMIAFQSDRGGSYDIYTMNRNGNKIDKLTTNRAEDEDPAFSPNGKTIAFTSDRRGDNDIYTMSVKGRRLVRLTTNTKKFDRDPSWSPDGKKILFRSDRHGSSDIYMMSVKGHKLVRLTSDPAVDTDASFSPDGKKIVFATNRNGNDYDIYKMNANGTRVVPLTNNPAVDEDPSFSPDGKRIVFRSNRDGNSDIYKMNADRSKRARVVRLTTNPADDEDPAFSPDGKRIAFESDRDGDSDVYKMNVRGRNLVQLTNDPATTFGADWAVR